MNIDRGLQAAIVAVENDPPNPSDSSQWLPVMLDMVSNNAFTVGQAASILGVSRQYATVMMSKHVQRPPGRRTTGGVAGTVNREDLGRLRFLRSQMIDHPTGTKVPDEVRKLIHQISDRGTSYSVLAHLAGMPKTTVYQILRQERASGRNV